MTAIDFARSACGHHALDGLLRGIASDLEAAGAVSPAERYDPGVLSAAYTFAALALYQLWQDYRSHLKARRTAELVAGYAEQVAKLTEAGFAEDQATAAITALHRRLTEHPDADNAVKDVQSILGGAHG